jgi:hypothetical protein
MLRPPGGIGTRAGNRGKDGDIEKNTVSGTRPLATLPSFPNSLDILMAAFVGRQPNSLLVKVLAGKMNLRVIPGGDTPGRLNRNGEASPLRNRIQPRQVWLPRLIYRCVMLLAAGLAVVVMVAPLLGPERAVSVWGRIWQLFALDSLVRKTAVVAAVGLWLAAVIFFRSPRLHEPGEEMARV